MHSVGKRGLYTPRCAWMRKAPHVFSRSPGGFTLRSLRRRSGKPAQAPRTSQVALMSATAAAMRCAKPSGVSSEGFFKVAALLMRRCDVTWLSPGARQRVGAGPRAEAMFPTRALVVIEPYLRL